MNLVRGMAGELFADIREHFQVSQPANERMPQAVIAKRTELTPFASLYRPMRYSNSSLIHQSAKHVRETAMASAGFAIKGTKNRRLRIVADRKRFEIIDQVGMQKDNCLTLPAVFACSGFLRPEAQGAVHQIDVLPGQIGGVVEA